MNRKLLLFGAMAMAIGTSAQIFGPTYNAPSTGNVGIGAGVWSGAKLYVLANPPSNGGSNIGTWSEAGASSSIGALTGVQARAYSLGGTCTTGAAGTFDLYSQSSGSFTNGIGLQSLIPATVSVVNGTGLTTQVLAGSSSSTGLNALVSSSGALKYGLRTNVSGSGTTSWGGELWSRGATTNYGAYCEVSSSGTTGYGVYGIASGMTSFQAGVYGVATPNGTLNQQNGVWSGNTSWAVYSNGPQFSTTHSLWGTSDERLKNNIRALTGALQSILQLEPKVYTYKRELHPTYNLPLGDQMGLISQEVEKVLPTLVMDTHYPDQYNKDGELIDKGFDVKVMNYNGFIPILISAVKEQHAIVEEQRTQLALLRSRVDELEDIIRSSPALDSSPINNPSARLYQNQPNPFREATTIKYRLPDVPSKCRIDLWDSKGDLIMTFGDLGAGEGQLMLDAGSLSSGTYSFALVVDGAVVDSKTLLVTK